MSQLGQKKGDLIHNPAASRDKESQRGEAVTGQGRMVKILLNLQNKIYISIY
jgi:hypothetical protein